jgi:hypothetical protein
MNLYGVRLASICRGFSLLLPTLHQAHTSRRWAQNWAQLVGGNPSVETGVNPSVETGVNPSVETICNRPTCRSLNFPTQPAPSPSEWPSVGEAEPGLLADSIYRSSKRQLVAIRIEHVEIAFAPRSVPWDFGIKSLLLQMCPKRIHVRHVED